MPSSPIGRFSWGISVCALFQISRVEHAKSECRSDLWQSDILTLIRLLVNPHLTGCAFASPLWSWAQVCLGCYPELKGCTAFLQGQSLCHRAWLPKTSWGSELHIRGDYSDSDVIFGLQWIRSCGSVFQLFKRQKF